MSDWMRVASLDEIPEGGLRVLAGDEEILLVRAAAGIRAMAYLCSHQELALEGGCEEGGSWICPHHGAKFSLETGEALSMPAISGVQLFQVKEESGSVYVML